MTCTRTKGRLVDPPEGVRIMVPFDDATMLAMVSLQHDIFDDPEPADANSAARLRFGLERDARALVAVDSAGFVRTSTSLHMSLEEERDV